MEDAMSDDQHTRIYTAVKPKGKSNIVTALTAGDLKSILHANLDRMSIVIESADGLHRITAIDIVDNGHLVLYYDESILEGTS